MRSAKFWLTLLLAALFILLSACEPATSISPIPTHIPTTQPEPSGSDNQTDNLADEPQLSTELKRGCQIGPDSRDFEQAGLAVGTEAINFTLKDLWGDEIRLSRLLTEKPVVMIFGSFT